MIISIGKGLEGNFLSKNERYFFVLLRWMNECWDGMYVLVEG